ncbi:MAG: glycosyltransferase family 39 protein [Deltaproteobacteria bacterium]|nr:glycosyltransferase family 39 protein [Deltaproteobacteria bacterium]
MNRVWKGSQKPYLNAALALVAVSTVLRAFWSARVDLSPDEAYYWFWSLSPAWGYLDHPPMLAWLVGLFSGMVPGELGVRLPALLLGASSQLLLYKLCTDLWGSARWGLAVVIAINSTVLFSAGACLSTPDAPLIFFWLASLYLLARALDHDGTTLWLSAGIFAGLALLSKYTAGLLGITAVAYLLSSKKRMKHLKKPGPYLGLLAAFVVFLPNLVWNAEHGFVSMGFQTAHIIRGSGSGFFQNLGEFLAGQALLVNPLIFFTALFAFSSRRFARAAGEPAAFFRYFFAIPFLLFLAAGCAKKLEANWPAVAWPAAMVLVIGLYKWGLRTPSLARTARMAAWLGVAMGLTMVAIAYVHSASPFLPTPPKRDPTARLRGWHELARDVSNARDTIEGGHLPLYTRRYQEASILAFYDRKHSPPRAFGPGWRKSQFDLYPDPVSEDDAALILWETGIHVPLGLSQPGRLKRIGHLTRRDKGTLLTSYDIYLRSALEQRRK